VTSAPILTIAIPTFNRVDCLRLLLRSLELDPEFANGLAEVRIFDNASEDGTEDFCRSWVDRYKCTEYIRNSSNVGAINNVRKCFDSCRTEYLWIIGDDDVIRIGALTAILHILRTHSPELFYFRNGGFDLRPEAEEIYLTEPVRSLIVDSRRLCRLVNVHFTFLSTIIVKRSGNMRAFASGVAGFCQKTQFPQLSWVLPGLVGNRNHVYVRQSLILARGASSGGYDLLHTFSTDLAGIVRSILPEDLADTLLRNAIPNFLVRLVGLARQGRIGRFDPAEDGRAAFEEAYGKYLAHRVLTRSAFVLPLPVSSAFGKAVRVSYLIYRRTLEFMYETRLSTDLCNGKPKSVV